MDDKLQEEILAVGKIKPKDNESAEDFTLRVTKKLHGAADAVWEATPEDVQAWVNGNILADEKGEGLDLLTLPEPVEAAAQEDDDEAEEEGAPAEGDAEADVEQETEVSEKAKPKAKKKPAAKTEAKADAPKKAAAPKPAAKPKAAAKPAPVKKPVAAKKPAAAKGDRGRKPLFPDDGKIKVLAKDNPHREGTVRDKAFKKIKSGMTVAEAVKAGAPRQQVWSMWKRGVISVTGASA